VNAPLVVRLNPITVRGLPAPQGSKRHVGKGVMVESSKHVKPWREAVKHAALEVVGDDFAPLDGPLLVSMVFSFARPKGHYRTGRNADLLRDSAPLFPHGKPDVSKLARSTEDALTGIVWSDDSRIVEYELLAKRYAGSVMGDVLTGPGCVIRVATLGAVSRG
jgi:Holliday junction resolvase RusA-like endonuclease